MEVILTKDVVPYVLFSDKKAVYKKDIRIGQSLWEAPEKIVELENDVVCFDLFQLKQIMYLCDNSGEIFKANLSVTSNEKIQAEKLSLDWNPSLNKKLVSVSIDWLNEKAYFLLKHELPDKSELKEPKAWSIIHCDLNGMNCVNMKLDIDQNGENVKEKRKEESCDKWTLKKWEMERM